MATGHDLFCRCGWCRMDYWCRVQLELAGVTSSSWLAEQQRAEAEKAARAEKAAALAVQKAARKKAAQELAAKERLPRGWEEAADDDDVYYFNSAANTSQWERPSGPDVSSSAARSRRWQHRNPEKAQHHNKEGAKRRLKREKENPELRKRRLDQLHDFRDWKRGQTSCMGVVLKSDAEWRREQSERWRQMQVAARERDVEEFDHFCSKAHSKEKELKHVNRCAAAGRAAYGRKLTVEQRQEREDASLVREQQRAEAQERAKETARWALAVLAP